MPHEFAAWPSFPARYVPRGSHCSNSDASPPFSLLLFPSRGHHCNCSKNPPDPPSITSIVHPLYSTAHSQSFPCFSTNFSTLSSADLTWGILITPLVTRFVDVGLANTTQFAIIPDLICHPLYRVAF